jgi:hypothetical protein
MTTNKNVLLERVRKALAEKKKQTLEEIPIVIPEEIHSEEKASAKPKRGMTPLKAIAAKCLDCSGRSKSERLMCAVTDCPLYPYRCGIDEMEKSDDNP